MHVTQSCMYGDYVRFQCTVYALTFVGLNFRGFRSSAAICESFARENLDQVEQRSLYDCVTILQNGGDSRRQL